MANTQEPQGTQTPAATEPSTHEWATQADSFYGGEAQPTGGDSTSTTASQATPSPNGNPLARWGLNLARGPADAANAEMRTAAEASVRYHHGSSPFKAVFRNTPIVGPALDAGMEAISNAVGNDSEQAKKVSYASEDELEAAYGAKPHDFFGQLLHGSSQFLTGQMIAAPLAGFGAIGAAFAMGTAFDPYEKSLANWGVEHEKALRAIPGVGAVLANVAKQLAVTDKDGPVEARIKKAVEGEVLGKLTNFMLRPVTKGLGWALAKNVAEKAGDTGAAARAEAEIARARGPQPTDVVEVVPNPDGTLVVRPIVQNGSSNGHQPVADLAAMSTDEIGKELQQITSYHAATKAMQENGLNVPERAAESARMQERGDQLYTEIQRRGAVAKSVPTGTVDVMKQIKELGLEQEVRSEAKQRAISGEQPSASDVELAARTVLHDYHNARLSKEAPEVTYTDEAAARSDAATINGAAYERSRGGTMFTPEEVQLHQQTAEALEKGDVSVLNNGTPHFNLQSMGTSDAVDAQINSLSSQFGDLLTVAQGRPSVPDAVLHHQAAQWASEVHLDNFLPAMAKADAAGRVTLSIKASLYNAALKQAGQEVAELGALMRAKPGDEALEFLARRRLETMLRVSEATANFNTELGRGLRALSVRDTESAAGIRFGSEVSPRPEIMTPKGQPIPPFDPQRLSPSQLGSMVRLFERSGGDARVAAHVVDAFRRSLAENKEAWAKMSDFDKNMNQLVTVFVNSIISGFKTAGTIATSGAVMNGFRASAKILGGVGTLNRGLAEEGAAQMGSLFYYARASARGAWGAFKENRSIIDGTPPYHVDASKIMTAIQVPGRVAGALDEFTRVAAYRADEFAAAFRQARNEGLELADAFRRADYDVSQSVDKATGIGLNPVALKRAGIPTLSDNLGNSTFMGKLSNAVADYPLTKLVVPFIRPSVNTFRFAHANTPILNAFSRDAQAILQKGGEEATVLYTQSALAGSMMVYSMSKFMDGEITGNGPKDPTLRAEWSRNHQPYSVKINGKWHSYRRYEPFATFFGTIADGMDYYHAIPDEDRDTLEEKATAGLSAVFAGIARNTTSKSWTESLLNALTALDDKDDNAWRSYITSTVSGLVPYSAALRQFNMDPAWHEVRGFLDGVRQEIPGYSDHLPARYDWSGEKRVRQGDWWNRNMALSPSMDAKPTVEDQLVDNYIRLNAPNPRPFKGIDMWDQKWANSAGKVPYEVLMEKLAATGVRKKVEDMVKSDNFNGAPKGNASYPQSLRGDLVQQIVGGNQLVATQQMLAEFEGNGFAKAYRNAQYVVPAVARYQGQEAADSVKRANNISTNIRR